LETLIVDALIHFWNGNYPNELVERLNGTTISLAMSSILFSLLFVCLAALWVNVNALTDNHEMCQQWAETGECDHNPGYMLPNCAKACAAVSTESANVPDSFYDIVETDIDGKTVDFSQFAGKVVYVTNVASRCGYTAENYELFRSLAKHRSDEFEIVLAPCNQFGFQEPGDAKQISDFADKQKFEGIVLSKADVNGGSTRPLFMYLKKASGKHYIQWNFDGKFIVDKAGKVHVPTKNVENDILNIIEDSAEF
jgi:glutathione peroxidase